MLPPWLSLLEQSLVNNQQQPSQALNQPPPRGLWPLPGVVPADPRQPYDVRAVLARLLDGSRFQEFKARYGPTLVTGFGSLYGMPLGVVANNGGRGRG